MMSAMSLHPYPKGALIGRQISTSRDRDFFPVQRLFFFRQVVQIQWPPLIGATKADWYGTCAWSSCRHDSTAETQQTTKAHKSNITHKNTTNQNTSCESLCPLQGYNLALVRAAIHWVFGSGTGLWEDVCNRLEQFRCCFVVFEAAGVALRYRPVGLSESTWNSRHFKYSLEFYLALWYWANASRSIRYAIESGCYDSIDLGSSLTSWRSMNLTEIVLDHPFRFL